MMVAAATTADPAVCRITPAAWPTAGQRSPIPAACDLVQLIVQPRVQAHRDQPLHMPALLTQTLRTEPQADMRAETDTSNL